LDSRSAPADDAPAVVLAVAQAHWHTSLAVFVANPRVGEAIGAMIVVG